MDEEAQADYLVRYYLLTLGTGLVERVFWWQVVARGYGLVDPADPARPRRRPSFHALKTLVRELDGARLEEVLAAPPPARLYRFRRPDGAEVVVGWSAADRPARAALPRPAVVVIGRDGEELAGPGGRRGGHRRLSEVLPALIVSEDYFWNTSATGTMSIRVGATLSGTMILSAAVTLASTWLL